MDLTHSFTVPASVEDTWAAFNDIESVAGCFPGATVSSVEGDEFKGSCKVKLGPISLVYSGSGHFVERDETAHRFVIEAKGKDKRGNGTAGALVTAVFTSASPSTTHVEVNTDLAITGKPAQFGRGVMQDVSDKLLQQFADCLESTVGEPGDGKHTAAAAPPAPEAGTSAEANGGGAVPGAAATSSPAETGGVSERKNDEGAKRVSGPGAAGRGNEAAGRAQQADALDLGATVLPILLKSYGKQIAVALVVLYLLKKLRGRSRR